MAEKKYKQSEGKKALVDLRTHKKIFHVVLITHIVIITMVLVWGFAIELFKPKRPKALTVSLYTPPKAGGAPPAYTQPQKTTSPKKKVTKKPVKKKTKKKWKPAKKIKISKKLVYVKAKTKSPQKKTITKQKLLNSLKQKNAKIRTSKASGVSQNYENSVGAYLYQLWDTPDKSVLGNKRPEVKVQLHIAANGKLLSSKILKSSGIAAMDKSIEKLLKKIEYLPAPKGGAKKITLFLEVTE